VDDGSGACQVDDGFGVIYPDLVLDDEFISITGVVDYSFNEYGLHPRSMSDFDTGETPELTPVYDIQFTEDPSGDSPYAGQTVTVEGIVTGSGYLGSHYFISSAEGGAWSGIYVYDDSNTPAEGDLVRFTAEVAEYFGFTELTDVSSFEVLSSGNTLPEPEMISTNDLATQEAYESVLVIIQNLTVTAEPNEYNEWFVDDGSGACQVDDCFGYIPESIETGSGIFYAITGLVDYSYAEFGLNPRYEGDFQLVPANDDNVIGIYNHKAFPNPFYADNTRSSVTIGYSLSKSEDIQVNIYNIRGQKVIELMQGTQPAGNYQLNWDGFGAAANQQPAGVYFYQISGENFSRTGKLLLIR
jgi:hypothetical protein